MAHNHSHGHDHNHDDTSSRNLSFAFFLNLFFTLAELAGGILTNSVAILSDALHDFGDSIALGVSWYLQKLSQKGRDQKYSYGYVRFSLLGAVIIAVVLIIGSVFILQKSIGRILNPQEVNARGMLIMAVFGILINGAAVLRVKKGTTLNERAVYLHLLEDVLGWVAVLIASVVMLFVDAPILDPILSIAICIWVLGNVYKNLKETFRILLQKIPEDVDVEKVQQDILKIDGVESLHDIHLWSMDGNEHIMTLHVVIADYVNFSRQVEIKSAIREICNSHGIHHPTIEIETTEENCELIDC